MSEDPKKRADFSRFLVHLTRNTGGFNAEENLISIIKSQKIEARNFHCLFSPKLKKMKLTPVLKNRFKTVCFTETPLDQIHKLTSDKIKRKIKLRPFGLVFWRDEIVDEGGNPAIYVNGDSTGLKKFLLSEFDKHFKDIRKLKELRKQEEYYKEIVHYYSLVNVISNKYDFTWEREWRYNGDFNYKYRDLAAIVAKNPEKFEELCRKSLSKTAYKKLEKVPVISPNWGYEEVIEEFSIKLWNTRG